MYQRRKLKADFSITGLLPAIVALSIFILTVIFWNFETGIRVLGVMFLLYSLFQFYAWSKVRNLPYFISSSYMLSVAIFLFLAPVSGDEIAKHQFTAINKFLTFTSVFLLLWLVYLMLSRKIKWKGREIFELAAMTVQDSTNGFTERPRPAGTINYTRKDLIAFSTFLRKNLIAMPWLEEDKVVFVPVKMGQEFAVLYTLRPDYTDKTWISFDFKGNVSVYISKKDYLEYVEELSFDQLCESMGNLFKEFLELFMKGEEVRIISRLDAMKINVFS